MISQLLSIVGAALILVAYAGNQRGWTGPDRLAYNLMNLVGALLLLWVALVDRRAGFILLESVWAAVTIPPLWRSLGSDDRGSGPEDEGRNVAHGDRNDPDETAAGRR